MKPSPKFLYTALGDSITEGYSAPRKQGYAHMLACHIRRRNPSFRLYNAGKKGLTSRHLLRTIRLSPPITWLLHRSSLLTLWIGGNDLLYAYIQGFLTKSPRIYERTLAEYRYNLDHIFARIRRISSAPLIVCNLYNPFPHSGLAQRWIGEYNQALLEVCNRWGVPLVDIHSVFPGREAELIYGYRTGRLSDIPLIGRRPVHPNGRGHEAIAATLWGVIHSE